MSMYVVPRAVGIFKANSNMSGSTETVDMNKSPIPCTITLKSSNASRAIQLSTDGGTEFFTPVYDTTSATMLVVTINTPISNVKFTGQAADSWSIR